MDKHQDLAFAVMRETIERYSMTNLFNTELPMLKLMFYQLDRLISIHLPDLHNHFKVSIFLTFPFWQIFVAILGWANYIIIFQFTIFRYYFHINIINTNDVRKCLEAITCMGSLLYLRLESNFQSLHFSLKNIWRFTFKHDVRNDVGLIDESACKVTPWWANWHTKEIQRQTWWSRIEEAHDGGEIRMLA